MFEGVGVEIDPGNLEFCQLKVKFPASSAAGLENPHRPVDLVRMLEEARSDVLYSLCGRQHRKVLAAVDGGV